MFICGNPDIFTFFEFEMLEKHVKNAIFVREMQQQEFDSGICVRATVKNIR